MSCSGSICQNSGTNTLNVKFNGEVTSAGYTTTTGSCPSSGYVYTGSGAVFKSMTITTTNGISTASNTNSTVTSFSNNVTSYYYCFEIVSDGIVTYIKSLENLYQMGRNYPTG